MRGRATVMAAPKRNFMSFGSSSARFRLGSTSVYLSPEVTIETLCAIPSSRFGGEK